MKIQRPHEQRSDQPPGECKNYSTTYFPDTIVGNGLPGEQTYEDTVHVTGTNRFTAATHENTATANCPLCPPTPH